MRESNKNLRTPEEDVETAVMLTGFGKFNIKIAIFSGLVYLNTGFGLSSVSFILPSAVCDFEMTTIDKGRISTAPFLGMIIGAYFWGCLADVKGRKKALFISLSCHAISGAISSIIPNYWGFLVFQFLCGFSIQGSSTIIFTFVGEFQPAELREKILCWLEVGWSVGLILLPLIAWAIIPLNISVVMGTFSFHSWNLFVVVCSVPSFLLALWLLSFPETPKYLAEIAKNTKLAETLDTMHKQNTGKSFIDYLEILSKNGCHDLSSKLKNLQVDSDNNSDSQKLNKIQELFKNIFKQTILLFKPPLSRKTFNVCSLMFCLGSTCYPLLLWFPEISQRFVEFEKEFPTNSASVCNLSQFKLSSNVTVNECPTKVATEVYFQTLVVGLTTLPLSVMLPLFVDKLGYKFNLVATVATASVVTLGLLFMDSSNKTLILSSIFEATLSASIGLMFFINVDLFPTNSRGMAAALGGISIRVGAFSGTTIFGYLIDNYCTILIITLTCELFVCVGLAYLLPIQRKKKIVPIENSRFQTIPEI